MRAAAVSEPSLAKLAETLNLSEYLIMGKGAGSKNGRHLPSVLSDAMEAVVAAIYLEAGFEFARNFVLELFKKYCPDPREQLLSLNPKGRLQEISQHRWGCVPSYKLFRQTGLQHLPVFEVELRVANFVAIGSGGSRKLAEIAAAKIMCDYLKKR
jgi:ribonuclease-3